MRKIVNINTTSTKEEQLKDLITSIEQVKRFSGKYTGVNMKKPVKWIKQTL